MKFLLSINYLVWLVASATFFAVGEYLSKKFALNPKFSYVILLLIVDFFVVITWLPAILQKNSLSFVGTIWSVLSLLTTILIGILIFKEKLNLVGIIGIFFALIAIILLSIN